MAASEQHRIVCSAMLVKVNEYQVIIPSVRHFDMLVHGLIALVSIGIRQKFPHLSNGQIASLFHDAEQGFVDNRGEFLTREEAWPVAMNANQIIHRHPSDQNNGGTLWSENIH